MTRPASRIRVTHVVKGLGPGGAERLLLTQVAGGSDDFDYRVVTLLDHKDHLTAQIEATGTTVECIGSGWTWPLRLALELRTETDIVHIHSPVPAAVVRLLRLVRGVRIPVVTTEHNRWQRHHRATRLLNRLTAALDTATLAVSEDVRDSMTARLRSEVRVLTHGVPVAELTAKQELRNATRSEFGIEDSVTVIGIVANFRPEKGYDTFLRAAVLLTEQDRAGSAVHFLVIGQGPGEEAFRSEVRTVGLKDSITIVGYHPDATSVMSAFDIFTLTSRHEGLPVSLMEALALGLPIVATRAGGIPEAITDGVEGRLVPVDDSVAVSEAWAELSRSSSLRNAMGKAALARAGSFDSSTSTSEIESLYRSLL